MESLENYGVHIMNSNEIKKIYGGNPFGKLLRVVAAALAALHDQVCDGEGQCSMNLSSSQSADYYKYRAM